MTVEQAIKELKKYSIPCGKYVEAYNMAIKSLEAWNEVKKEISSRRIIKNYTESYDKSACDIYLSGFKDGLESALDIIEEHLKEIEE